MMRIGDLYRYARPYDPKPEKVDGIPNYFHATSSPGRTLALLDAGINPIKAVNAPDGSRVPAILISSSPHKIGSAETPWQDFFDPDHGHIRYCGDAKEPGIDPAEMPGNRMLLNAFQVHNAMEAQVRREAVPIVCFLKDSHQGIVKGHRRFQGFGVISKAELVTQYNQNTETSFPNFAYDITVLSLAEEKEEFDWRWITDRRNSDLRIEHTLRFAPTSWKTWFASGYPALARVKRQVSKLMTVPTKDQTPRPGSRERKVLKEIYSFYDGKKVRFEALAAVVTERIFVSTGVEYKTGWITPSSADGGADFIGRIDLGSGLATVKQVVYGQAKCEKIDGTTSGRDIARTVARLKRGWIGVYVTTGAFSEPVQREVIDDNYPILLVSGERLAREVVVLVQKNGHKSTKQFLESVDDGYEKLLANRRPEEILTT